MQAPVAQSEFWVQVPQVPLLQAWLKLVQSYLFTHWTQEPAGAAVGCVAVFSGGAIGRVCVLAGVGFAGVGEELGRARRADARRVADGLRLRATRVVAALHDYGHVGIHARVAAAGAGERALDGLGVDARKRRARRPDRKANQ